MQICAVHQIFGSLLDRVVEILVEKLPWIALVDAVELIVQFLMLVWGMTAWDQLAYVVGYCLWIMHLNPAFSLLISSLCRVDPGIFVIFLSFSKDLYQGMSVTFGHRVVFTILSKRYWFCTLMPCDCLKRTPATWSSQKQNKYHVQLACIHFPMVNVSKRYFLWVWLVGSLDSGGPLGLVRVISCTPFTHIQILLKLQLFLSGFKNFPVHMFLDSLWICYFPLRKGNLKICGFTWAGGWRLNLVRKSCGFKNIRICVDGALV